MATKKQLKKVVSEFGAAVSFNKYNPYDQSTDIEVWAPDGYVWKACDSQVLLGIWYRCEGTNECYNDLIKRMQVGLTPIEE